MDNELVNSLDVTESQTASTEAEALESPTPEARVRKTTRGRRRTAAVVEPEADAEPEAESETDAGTETHTEPEPEPAVPLVPESPLSLLFHAPDLSAIRAVTLSEDAEDNDDEDDDDTGSRRRRNRRGRGRSRTEGAVDSEEPEADAAAAGEAAEDEEGVTSRRRRRRRRGEQDLELTGGQDDDPPNTVTRVRAPRQQAEPAVSNRVAGVKGSTRLEAKKQRRRESRDSGRRRQVITEAEFLARRESVDRQMVVRQRDDRIQIAVLEDGVLAEHFVSKTQQDSLIGNVYVGKVQNVLPSMEAAFVDIGRGRNAVLYAGEVNWDAAGLDGQPRRIELALKSGDTVLVQVTKDPVGHKGARLTSQISLPGRYLVYVPGGSMTGISRKLPDVERNRLKKILKDRLPENAGVIVRTAAEGASEEELTHDINRLRAQWEDIQRKATSTKTLAPELLYGEPDLTIKVVRDVFNEDFSKLIVSGEEAWDTIEAYVTYVAPDLVSRLEKWTGEEDIFAASRIDEQIYKALDRKVFLPSGGSLVIDRTEAMTVVDVNTGKFTGTGGNLEETVTKNNLEAAEEIVRQLRLRDIGGIIVIDFIDMVLEANRDLVLRRLVECLGRDRTKHQVAEVTSLGLVQMTRKRMGTGLLEVFSETCEACAGRGVVTHDEPVEHRRSHAVAPDNHQQHLRQEKQSRSERKRNRNQGGRGQDVQAPVEVEPAPVEDLREDPARLAKAEAARAALATIAAATHAAHEAEEHRDTPVPATARDFPAAAREHELPAASVAPAALAESVEPAALAEAPDSEAVVTINGEPVMLPRRARRATSATVRPELTLESLAEVFDRHSGEAEAPAAAEPAAPAPAAAAPAAPVTTPATAAPVRRARRNRSASRAQGAANEAIVEQRAAATAPEDSHVHTASLKEVGLKEARLKEAGLKEAGSAARPSAEPMILGVGVPASEL